MSFKLDDIVIDRIQVATAEDSDGNLLYTLTQLSDATIEVSAESTDAVDAQGTLIKKFWKGKTGTFTATNALLNLNVIAAASGVNKEVASDDSKIQMPAIKYVKSGSTITISGYVDGTVKVYALASNGTLGKAYAKGTAASATEFALTSDGKLTPPTDTDESRYVVKYDRQSANGVAIRNKADKFPSTVKLTLKALCVDPCSVDTLRACYIVLPSFQVSPEISIGMTTDTTLDYTGDLQVDYCSDDKTLYEIYIDADDSEED